MKSCAVLCAVSKNLEPTHNHQTTVSQWFENIQSPVMGYTFFEAKNLQNTSKIKGLGTKKDSEESL